MRGNDRGFWALSGGHEIEITEGSASGTDMGVSGSGILEKVIERDGARQ